MSLLTSYEKQAQQNLDGYVKELNFYSDYLKKHIHTREFLVEELKVLDKKIEGCESMVVQLTSSIEKMKELINSVDAAPITSSDSTSSSPALIAVAIPVPASIPTNVFCQEESKGENKPLNVVGNEDDNGNGNHDKSIERQLSLLDGDGVNIASGDAATVTKVASRKLLNKSTNKYPLKAQYAGMSIIEAVELYMSQAPGQVYHIGALLKALYDGLTSDNAPKIQKSLATQLLLAVKNEKSKIKRSSHAATYYYSSSEK